MRRHCVSARPLGYSDDLLKNRQAATPVPILKLLPIQPA